MRKSFTVRLSPRFIFSFSVESFFPLSNCKGMDWPLFFILLGCGLMAGFVDSIAGGGGLIGLPVLLSLGVPPHVALGTNKLQACFGSGTVCFQYRKHRLMSIRANGFGIACTAFGAALGTLTVSYLEPGFLKPLILIMLAVVFVWVWINPDYGKLMTPTRMGIKRFYLVSA